MLLYPSDNVTFNNTLSKDSPWLMRKTGMLHPPQRMEGLSASEMRIRVNTALDKLNNKATQKTGATELLAIANDLPNLDSSLLAAYMSCLLETNPSQQLAYKKEVLFILSAIAPILEDRMTNFLPKIVSMIVHFLKDRDSNVRDHASDTIANIVANVPPPIKENPLIVYFKPFFELAKEQNKNVASGAIQCLTSVIRCSHKEVLAEYAMTLSTRFIKMISDRSLEVTPNLLLAMATLVDVTGLEIESNLPVIVRSVVNELSSQDWQTRKAAADAIIRMSGALPDRISHFQDTILPALESNKFDKMKPVRDSTLEAMRSLGASTSVPPSPRTSPGPGAHAAPIVINESKTRGNLSRKNSLTGVSSSPSKSEGC
eukprot:TRINITY_DN6116_c0_g1_i2.p1 TRINITY_DN6116_c0_g1~~TRINITY_DN6116_c0_g1_i2.p1  ORF type:complete len:372 (+),score=54.45 TRINITY_DN6116_c0_g1_i2:21-1136(+)